LVLGLFFSEVVITSSRSVVVGIETIVAEPEHLVAIMRPCTYGVWALQERSPPTYFM
jgi:hypothetical protein